MYADWNPPECGTSRVNHTLIKSNNDDVTITERLSRDREFVVFDLDLLSPLSLSLSLSFLFFSFL